MNILPKKRWHVRTKENIARVRRDEAEAAEKERLETIRIENADREARLNLLKNKSKEKLHISGVVTNVDQYNEKPKEHVNFFTDLERATRSTNKDHEKEVQQKKEEYEKQIGYLTYLGQDTNEALGKKNWYEVLPESSRFGRSSEIKDTYNKLIIKDVDGKLKDDESKDIKDGEVAWKAKQRLDPINAFRDFLQKKTTLDDKKKIAPSKSSKYSQIINIKKKLKQNSGSNETDKNNKINKLQKLREERLKRELKEKEKTKTFLARLNGAPSAIVTKPQSHSVIPKYNSQFNPELARQNYY